MDESNRQESLRLWDVLERVGISERMRQLRKNTSTQREIVDTLADTVVNGNRSQYVFGSSIEGTATPGMNSDRDIVYCFETPPVIHDVQQAPPGLSIVTAADAHTRPGYVKLQCVYNKVPLTASNYRINNSEHVYDCSGRVCRKHLILAHRHVQEVNGPAFTCTDPQGHGYQDNVPAFRSKTFPRVASESLQECVRSGWLTRSDAEELMKLGCLFVGVGHPASEEREIEWRISFSLQERQLMFRLNPTQHKCFALLKLIKCMLTSQLGSVKSITTYHCKSCLFSAIVKLNVEQWKPENLINCTFICLHELLICLYNSNCPNFFIKSNNLFEQRIDSNERIRLIVYIRELLKEGHTAFHRIKTDNIGERFRGNMRQNIEIIEMKLDMKRFALPLDVCTSVVRFQHDIHAFTGQLSKDDVEPYLLKQICYMSSVDKVTEHSQEEVRSAKSILMPILHKLYSQHMASQAFETGVPSGYKVHLLQASARHLKLGMAWDMMSGRLLYATILYRQGSLDSCCNLLEQIGRGLHGAVTTLCKCCCSDRSKYANPYFVNLVRSSDFQPTPIMQSLATCITFLPYQREIIPAPVQFEMYRSLYTTPGTRDKLDDEKWFDWAVVDSKVYLYLMQYLVYRGLNKPDHAAAASQKLLQVLVDDRNLGHEETGYNLLGWIYLQEGRIPAAQYCFQMSWVIRPHHNAAKWHMLKLFRDRQIK